MDQLRLASLFRGGPTGNRSASKLTGARGRAHDVTAQTLSLRAFTGYAFTIFRAGFAFTITTLPKTSRSPAFVAGFVRVLILHKPGTVKIPLLDTSFALFACAFFF